MADPLSGFKWRVRAPYNWEREQWMRNHTNFPLDWVPPTRPTVRPVKKPTADKQKKGKAK